jgi:hypothetical protein
MNRRNMRKELITEEELRGQWRQPRAIAAASSPSN